ncbi:hypothetical protein AVEN_200520-1 [Araneus ventricosus]|uniref:Uncharacterized protein n=1 Tax=Araneus ventricosus TaxID=182803 RepID=A0A4Y2MPH7_ARAVE|nr:hypothetical protein AVEN_200520-1 [Araneus ventricosus]
MEVPQILFDIHRTKPTWMAVKIYSICITCRHGGAPTIRYTSQLPPHGEAPCKIYSLYIAPSRLEGPQNLSDIHRTKLTEGPLNLFDMHRTRPTWRGLKIYSICIAICRTWRCPQNLFDMHRTASPLAQEASKSIRTYIALSRLGGPQNLFRYTRNL